MADEIYRVRAVSEYGTFEGEFETLRPGRNLYPATRAVRIDDVLLYAGQVFTSRSFEAYQRDPEKRRLARGAIASHGEGLLATNWVSENFFGHWLVDGLPLERIARDAGKRAVTLSKRPWWHEATYRGMLGLHAEPVESGHFEHLWMVDGGRTNSAKLACIEGMRSVVRCGQLAAASGTATGRGVFIRRGRKGQFRQLTNEEEIIETLSREGFEILDPDNCPVETIIRHLASAPIVVGVEGSALFHAVLALPPGAALITIQPPRRLLVMLKTFTDALGLRFGFVVAEGRLDGFHQPVDRLLLTIELAVKQAARERVSA